MRQSLYSFKSPHIDVWTTGCQNETKISCVHVDLPSPENNVGRSDFLGVNFDLYFQLKSTEIIIKKIIICFVSFCLEN